METAKPRVLLDVDGVLADFVGGFLEVIRKQLGRSYLREEITSFGIANSLALSKEEFDLCALLVNEPGFCASLDVYPGAVEGVARLMDVADVYIVTSPWNTNPTWTHDREAWLWKHFGIPSKRVVHTNAKHICRGDFLVDDKTDTLRSWVRENPYGIAVQWKTPHNRRDGWLSRATDSWDDLVALVAAHGRLRHVEAGLTELRRQANWPGEAVDLADDITPLPPAPDLATEIGGGARSVCVPRTRAMDWDTSDKEHDR